MSPPLGIYVHVPFCAVRCGYCDFNTYVPDGPDQPLRFVEAALAELRRAAAELGSRPASTVFFGGGTPTLLGPDALVRLLDGVGSTVGLAAGVEVTTEANPESVDPAREPTPTSTPSAGGTSAVPPTTPGGCATATRPPRGARCCRWSSALWRR